MIAHQFAVAGIKPVICTALITWEAVLFLDLLG